MASHMKSSGKNVYHDFGRMLETLPILFSLEFTDVGNYYYYSGEVAFSIWHSMSAIKDCAVIHLNNLSTFLDEGEIFIKYNVVRCTGMEPIFFSPTLGCGYFTCVSDH